MNRLYIDCIGISNVNLPMTIDYLNECISYKRAGYVCVTNSRTTYYANHNEAYCQIQNNSLLTVPDGMPIVWIAHNLGYKKVGRVCGADLFSAILKESVVHGYSHYFYGSTPEVISKIKKRFETEYPNIEIRGAVSPPFQPIEAYDVDSLATEINKLRPTFFWCGLGAPKQELLMALLQPKLESTICIGVGLVFEYFAGTVQRPPRVIQRMGLEGVTRSLQQPKQSYRRGLSPFIWILPKLIKTWVQDSLSTTIHK